MSEFLADKQDKNFTEEEYLYIAGALIEAGSDTTRTTLHQFVAGSALWPDWIVRGREQLDAVCGSNAERLPTMRDMPQLPLIKAAVKESMRWKYVRPFRFRACPCSPLNLMSSPVDQTSPKPAYLTL